MILEQILKMIREFGLEIDGVGDNIVAFAEKIAESERNKVKSANNLYIVVTYISYDGISGDTDYLYTDRAEAEEAAKKANEYTQKLNSSLKYSVMDLYEYISEVKSEATLAGVYAERERY